MTVASIIDALIGVEGGYTNNPSDPGGATMWGVTERVARANGYTGPMNAMPRATAVDIYNQVYVRRPGFANVMVVNEAVAGELVDTGANMGPSVAAMFFQRALNALNGQARYYPDVSVDGDCGPATISAFRSYMAKRGAQGESVMLKALNCLQGERYIHIAEGRPASEDFVFGWLANRVTL